MVSKHGNYKQIFKKYMYINRAVCRGGAEGASPLFSEICKGPNGFSPPLFGNQEGQECSASLLRRLGTVLVKDIILNIILL